MFKIVPINPEKLSFRDVEILARTLYGETASESRMGQVAVGWVIRNRAEIDLGGDEKPDWWGEGIAGVCLAKNQFSCWRMVSEAERRWSRRIATVEGRGLEKCLGVALDVLLGNEPDPTYGATHYFADYIAAPRWSFDKAGKPLTPTAKYGVHQFYRII